jgi:hypothetical protein
MSCIVWPQIWEPQALLGRRLGGASLGTMGAKERLPFLEIQGVEVIELSFLGQYYSNSSALTVSHNSKQRTVFEHCLCHVHLNQPLQQTKQTLVGPLPRS